MALFWKLVAAILGLVLLAVAGCILLGEWVLVLVFTESIRDYAYLLLPTILCCGVIALIWFMGAVLTILRDRKGLLLGGIAGAAAAAVISWPCILKWGVDGVNISLFLSSAVTLLLFGIRFVSYMKKWQP